MASRIGAVQKRPKVSGTLDSIAHTIFLERSVNKQLQSRVDLPLLFIMTTLSRTRMMNSRQCGIIPRLSLPRVGGNVFNFERIPCLPVNMVRARDQRRMARKGTVRRRWRKLELNEHSGEKVCKARLLS